MQLVLIFSFHQITLDMAMNSALSLHALGIDHVFILVSDSVSVGTRTHRPGESGRGGKSEACLPPRTQAVCTEHFPAVYANTSCWWDTTPYPDNLVEDKFMARLHVLHH